MKREVKILKWEVDDFRDLVRFNMIGFGFTLMKFFLDYIAHLITVTFSCVSSLSPYLSQRSLVATKQIVFSVTILNFRLEREEH